MSGRQCKIEKRSQPSVQRVARRDCSAEQTWRRRHDTALFAEGVRVAEPEREREREHMELRGLRRGAPISRGPRLDANETEAPKNVATFPWPGESITRRDRVV